ncbi:phage exclusion protein Lit family protein [Anaeromyxobacter diazotrophicus]|uniref:phage exclusion protein Lit family protein n=1 Tax=Anaeromyxobacter diazotrophicus TaxID=2590199 RepID=UPI00158FD2C2|nr:phage exclusion protein Lit family protein [Anaeromyxobacter diazotrophicus]
MALGRDVARSIILVAPERVEQVRALVQDLTLIISNDGAPRCSIDPKGKTITVSRKMLEHLWCTALAYWVLYSRHLAGRTVTKREELDLTADKQTYAAMKLLKWSIDTVIRSVDKPWPEGLYRPCVNPDHGSEVHVANELLFTAVAFLLHHELSHYRLAHSAGTERVDTIDQERDADYEAANWMLGACRGEVLVKRSIGVATAFMAMVALDIHARRYEPARHPRSIERLINTLDRYVTDPHHVVWGLTVGSLKVHLDFMNVKVHNRAFESARQAAEEYAEVLSRQPASD